MRGVSFYLAGAVWIASLVNGVAAVRYVPSGGVPVYATIQMAINYSERGDTIVVQPGIYHESITFGWEDIRLTSTNPGDSNVVRTTVIQGDGIQSVVRFDRRQSSRTLFTGFTVRGGGGGIYCSYSNPSIVGNIIEENQAPVGGAIACYNSSPRIARNIMRNNSATWGGAIDSRGGCPLIEDNWIYNNTAANGGAASLSDEGRFLNNTLWENTPNSLYVEATGLVANNIIANSNSTQGVIAADLSVFKHNDVWGMVGTEVLPAAGTNGNFSCDPLFVNVTNFDLHLSAASPCINAGDLSGLRSTNELDFDGGSRVFAYRVDVGASEFCGTRNFPPIPNAGPDRKIFWVPGVIVTLDASASIDPEGAPLTFRWTQTAGPTVDLVVSNNQALFSPSVLEDYRFKLVVNDGINDSAPVTVDIVVTCSPPIASAGVGQRLAVVPEVLTLDGSHSLDREGQVLFYNWRQMGGPSVELTNRLSARPSFRPSGAGVYEFELTVSNQFSGSAPDRVTFYLGQVAPVANAGPTRYVSRGQFFLDGSGSFAPNNSGPLEYCWRQVSGPVSTLFSTNVAKPYARVPVQSSIAEAVFELVVKAGGLTSVPSTVRVVAVPLWRNTTISQVNGSFNTNLPTIIAFNGGNCDSGASMGFAPHPNWPVFFGDWYNLANVFTCDYTRDPGETYGARYLGYGDQLIVLLSALAPSYNQPIQTIGWSTGCMPACDIAERFNVSYKDPRFVVNRITLIDSGCRDFTENISNLFSNRNSGKPFWIDNYYALSSFRSGALNVEFPAPPADHGTPMNWYFPSWSPILNPYGETKFNNGVFAGAFFSVVGPGKNYQLETGKSEYHFGYDPGTKSYPPDKLIQMEPSIHPARLPGVVELIGPSDAALVPERNVAFSCGPVLNAVNYQLLVGPNVSRVDQVAWEGATPPNQPLPRLPFTKTWWTIRATDAYGTTSWADPRCVIRDCDTDGLSDEAEVLTYHTDPDNRDTDADGHLDQQEVLAGTDPLKPNMGFQLMFQLVSTNQLQFKWFSDSGNSYDLESSTTLESNSWQRIETFVAPTVPGLMNYIIPLPADAARFYRLRAVEAISRQ